MATETSNWFNWAAAFKVRRRMKSYDLYGKMISQQTMTHYYHSTFYWKTKMVINFIFLRYKKIITEVRFSTKLKQRPSRQWASKREKANKEKEKQSHRIKGQTNTKTQPLSNQTIPCIHLQSHHSCFCKEKLEKTDLSIQSQKTYRGFNGFFQTQQISA